jgi:hypothetical protein
MLKSESPNMSIIAAGDFNPASNGFSTNIINRQCHLKQVIKEPTRNSTILDLMLTDIHKFYQVPLVLAPIGTSDHCTIIWSLQEQMKHKQKSKWINVRPLKSSLLQAFEQNISEYNWSPVLNASCINDKVSKFLEITTEMVEAFFPLKSVKIQVDNKPFLNGRIKQLYRTQRNGGKM